MSDSDAQDRRKVVAEMLRKDVIYGKLEWYYISAASPSRGWVGGYLIQARGPTEAWTLYHRLNLHEGTDTETQTAPMPSSQKIHPSMAYRKLTKEEVEAL